MISPNLGRLKHFFGIPASAHHRSEQFLATLGGGIAIALILVSTRLLLGSQGVVAIVPSMGAAAVLVFAAPHSLFAQPWALLGGNILSALVGVACQHMLPDSTLAAALAVGLSIGVMHAARCLHPPGGATALAAVIGGTGIHDLGYGYAILPVGLNCLIILAVGVTFNCAFAWRRYPAGLMRYAAVKPGSDYPALSEAHIREALDQFNGVVDASPEEIHEIMVQSLAIAERSRNSGLPRIELGRFYCNDRPGKQWSVRQVVDERPSENPEHDLIVYRVVDGQGLHRHGCCTRTEFACWAGSELKLLAR